MEKMRCNVYMIFYFWLSCITILLLPLECGKKQQRVLLPTAVEKSEKLFMKNNNLLDNNNNNNMNLMEEEEDIGKKEEDIGKVEEDIGKVEEDIGKGEESFVNIDSLLESNVSDNNDNVIMLLSRAKPVKASSVWKSDVNNAVDGNLNQNAQIGQGCTHTAEGGSDYPWYMIDLQFTAIVDRVDIYNRMDCCSERLHKFNVFLTDSDDPKKFPTSQSCNGEFAGNLKGVPVHHVPCGNKKGRYLVIYINDKKSILSLCEVEAFGRYVDQCKANTHNCDSSNSSCQPLNTGGFKCVKNPVTLTFDIDANKE